MPVLSSRSRHCAHDLVVLFDRQFLTAETTRLISGGDEPFYRPACLNRPNHEIIFRADYFASALHEVAHWCIAGSERRLLEDYGYWYEPDGRNEVQQRLFEQVEVKPQAMEWMFSRACGFDFKLSADNLAGIGLSDSFKDAVAAQAQHYCGVGLPTRAARFAAALADFYGQLHYLDPENYQRGLL